MEKIKVGDGAVKAALRGQCLAKAGPLRGIIEDLIDEHVEAHRGKITWTATWAGLDAALPSIAEQLADVLECEAIRLRGEPFRNGEVGFEHIQGIEAAAHMVRDLGGAR